MMAAPDAPPVARPAIGRGLALATLGAVAFSAKAIIVKLAYRYGVDAVTLIMYRMLFALPLFAALAWWAGRGRPPLGRRDLADVALLGFLGYYLASFLDFAGLAYITASLERLILYTNPALVLALGWALHGERVTARQATAIGISYVGVLAVFGQEASLEGADVALGSALVLGGALSYAAYLVMSGSVVKRLGALRLTGWATSVACVLCIAQFMLLRPLEAAQVAPEVIWLSLLNATLCTFVPVLAVMMAIERVGATLTAQAGMIGPLATVAMGVWLLDEPFTASVANRKSVV